MHCPCNNSICERCVFPYLETVSKDVVNGYECTCVVGFTGTNCETDINDCEGDPCVHGTCEVSQLLFSMSY